MHHSANTSQAPEIITTAPTNDFNGPKKKPSRMGMFRRSIDQPREEDTMNRPLGKKTLRKSFAEDRSRPSLATLEEPESPRPSTSSPNGTVLTPPANRPSESSRSDASSGDRLSHQSPSHESPSTTPKKSTPFFKLRRAKKPPEPLFPLAHLQQKGKPLPGISSASSLAVSTTPRPASANGGTTTNGSTTRLDGSQRSNQSPATALFAPPVGNQGIPLPPGQTFSVGDHLP